MTNKRITGDTLAILKQADNQIMLSVRNQSIILYNQYIGNRLKNKTTFSSSSINPINTYTGEFTVSAKKNLKKAIEIINILNPKSKKLHPIFKQYFNHSLSFVTLTIPDNTLIHPTTAYQLLLRPFLQYLTKTHNCKYYIWKLEYQKRGQIHYHITTDIVLHWKIIKDKWNYLLDKANLMQDYKNEYQSNSPNSTDIHQVYKINSMVAYMQKEFLKSMQNKSPYDEYIPLLAAGLKYKTWDCTSNIKKVGYFKTELDYKQEVLLKTSITKEFDLAYKKVCDQCQLYIPLGIKTSDLLTDSNKQKLGDYLNFVRSTNSLF